MFYSVRQWLALPEGKRTLKDVSKLRVEDLFDGPLFSFQKNNGTRKHAGLVLRKLGYTRIQSKGCKLWVRAGEL